MTSPPTPRPTARVLLLDPNQNLFLIYTDGEISGIGLPPVWLPPGGGVEPGESYEEAALRELTEEVALTNVTLGPCLWLRTFPYEINGKRYEKHERYFVCQVAHFEIDATSAVDPAHVLGYKWWTVDEIEASPDLFAPRALAHLLRPVLAGDLADQPMFVDV